MREQKETAGYHFWLNADGFLDCKAGEKCGTGRSIEKAGNVWKQTFLFFGCAWEDNLL
jgi:hypothetical protein